MIASLVAGLAITGGAVAFAQQPPAPKPEAGPQADRRQAMMQRVCAEMPARTAGRLAYTEVKLAITEAQKAAWQTFTQDVKTALQPVQKQCNDRAAAPRPTTPPDAATQLSEREKMLTAMLETTKGLRLAVEKLTPALNDEQKKQVAEMVSHMGRGRGDFGRHGGHMHGRHGHGQGGGPTGDSNAAPPRPGGQQR
ncbi:MAG TPA: Spy/CpxP family protein refolding chaperone [Vineibacter sp.]|nr:Spy/CpxP family protein refolding chaperone [Vineibacter sp.]